MFFFYYGDHILTKKSEKVIGHITSIFLPKSLVKYKHPRSTGMFPEANISLLFQNFVALFFPRLMFARHECQES